MKSERARVLGIAPLLCINERMKRGDMTTPLMTSIFLTLATQVRRLSLVFVFLFVFPFDTMESVASAECWIVSGFKGYGANSASNYKMHEDGLSGMTFMLTVNGTKSRVTGGDGGSDEIDFLEVTPYLIVGLKGGVIETWGVDVEKRSAFYTQSKSGYSIFDGVKMFIGKLDGKCSRRE